MAKKLAINDDVFERTMISTVNRNADAVRNREANTMHEAKKNARSIFFSCLVLLAIIVFSVVFYAYPTAEMTFSLCAVSFFGGIIGYFVRDAVKIFM